MWKVKIQAQAIKPVKETTLTKYVKTSADPEETFMYANKQNKKLNKTP